MTPEEYKKQKLNEYFDNLPITENVETRKLSENTVCELTHMKYEEYLKKMGYHSYSEIKKRLGLE